jgi:hypothetical protein
MMTGNYKPTQLTARIAAGIVYKGTVKEIEHLMSQSENTTSIRKLTTINFIAYLYIFLFCNKSLDRYSD